MTKTGTSDGKRRRTASKETRRRQLIEATIDSIAAHGLTGTTMATVTKLAGLSMGLVGFHFQSKENLMKETLMHLVTEHREFWISRLQDAAMPPAEKLQTIIEAHFHPSICTPKRIAVWFAFFGEERYRETYREAAARFDSERFEATEKLCWEIVEEGGYDGIDPGDVAKTIECLADGLWLSLLLEPDFLSLRAARHQMQEFLIRTFPRHFQRDRVGGTSWRSKEDSECKLPG